MEHSISIFIGINTAWKVTAEIPQLGPSPQEVTPEAIACTLLNLTDTELLRLATSEKEAGFEGYRYSFIRLDKDGAFTLKRIHP